MKVFWSAADVGDAMIQGAVAIGNFDGVHRGHQALIAKVNELKGDHKSAVLTFSPHPSEVLNKSHAHFSLMTDDEKIASLAALSLDVAILQNIDDAYLQQSPEDFVVNNLVNLLRIKHVVVGSDFTFGKKALGDVALLTDLGKRYGFITHIIPPVMCEGARASSSSVRAFLRAGNVASARACLGRPFNIGGTVVSGQKKGADFGFPTANLTPRPGFPLANGIYATVLRYRSNDLVSATSVGTRPTVTPAPEVVVETHCLDSQVDLYGENIQVFFIARLRDEKKFSSIDELKQAMVKDCDDVRAMYDRDPAKFFIEK